MTDVPAETNRILEEHVPVEFARAKAVHARSEKWVLGFAFSVVPVWGVSAALFVSGIVGPVVAVMVPAMLTLAFLAAVILAVVQNSAASRPVIEYAREHLGRNVTGVTKTGVQLAKRKQR